MLDLLGHVALLVHFVGQTTSQLPMAGLNAVKNATTSPANDSTARNKSLATMEPNAGLSRFYQPS